MLQFVFDTDCTCTVDVYSFAEEIFNDGKLNFVLNPEKGNRYSCIFDSGSNQLFECELQGNDIYNSKTDDTILITVVMSSTFIDGRDSQQFVTNLSFEKKYDYPYISGFQVSTQTLVYRGNCYLIQEMYGVDLASDQEMKQSLNSNLCLPEDKNVGEIPQICSTISEREHLDNLIQDCVVCMAAIRDTIVLPCRHLCLCSSCGEQLLHQSPACPICRSTFRALLQFGNLGKYIYNSQQQISRHELKG